MLGKQLAGQGARAPVKEARSREALLWHFELSIGNGGESWAVVQFEEPRRNRQGLEFKKHVNHF